MIRDNSSMFVDVRLKLYLPPWQRGRLTEGFAHFRYRCSFPRYPVSGGSEWPHSLE